MTDTIAYLDYNATAPLRAEARAALMAALDAVGNPSSVHGPGRAARRIVEDAREAVASLAGVAPAQVVFTSGGTEANNLALRGAGRERVLVSAIDHDAARLAVAGAETLPVAPDGRVDPRAVAAVLARDARPALVSVMAANNETGVIQPVAEIAAVARDAGALMHCDAVQAAGRVALDFAGWGVDLMSLSAHKLGGPQGVGALIARDGVTLEPMNRGGGQERSRRGGTENVAGIAGFGAAARAALDGLADMARIAALRDRLEAEILAAVPDARVIGADAPRLANTSCLALPGAKAETIVMALDLAGVAVSAGAACSSGKVTRSAVLAAMGIDPDLAEGAIRVSLGWATGAADIDRFLLAYISYARRMGRAA